MLREMGTQVQRVHVRFDSSTSVTPPNSHGLPVFALSDQPMIQMKDVTAKIGDVSTVICTIIRARLISRYRSCMNLGSQGKVVPALTQAMQST